MTQQHPITPSDQQIDKWESELLDHNVEPFIVLERAFQAGADQELEACCKWLESEPDPGHVDLLRSCATALRTVRRPKPPSLKVQALRGLESLAARLKEAELSADLTILYRALEQLPENE